MKLTFLPSSWGLIFREGVWKTCLDHVAKLWTNRCFQQVGSGEVQAHKNLFPVLTLLGGKHTVKKKWKIFITKAANVLCAIYHTLFSPHKHLMGYYYYYCYYYFRKMQCRGLKYSFIITKQVSSSVYAPAFSHKATMPQKRLMSLTDQRHGLFSSSIPKPQKCNMSCRKHRKWENSSFILSLI